jgi:hypothetical protein
MEAAVRGKHGGEYQEYQEYCPHNLNTKNTKNGRKDLGYTGVEEEGD